MHVKEIDLSKQSCVHNKKSRGFERASSPTWWQGGNGDCSYAVQPQHPGGLRWLPINPFHAFFPFPIVKLLVHTRELSCFICPGQAQIWTECHPGALSDRGGGVWGVWCGCWLLLYLFCYISKTGPSRLRSLLFPGLVFAVPSLLQLFPSSPTFLLSICRAPLLLGCHPSFSPPLSQSEAWKLVKSSPSVPS